MPHLACCRVPVRIMLIDDDNTFLTMLSLKLRRRHAIVQYDNSLTAAIALENMQSTTSLFSHMIASQEEHIKEARRVNFDINQLHKIIYQPSRFDALGIIITDYTMPGLNGVDLCRKAPRHTKRILLTGDADEKIAVEAFNQGLIHRYVKKDTADIAKNLEKAIEELEAQYFDEISDEIMLQLQKDLESPLGSLFDFEFTRYVEDVFKKHDIVEYYLFDNHGSLLGLDSRGNHLIIAVRDAEDMRAAAEISHFEDLPVSKNILNGTASRKKLLFTGRQDDFSLATDQWDNYLFTVDFVDQAQKFYAAIIDNPPIKIDVNNVLSFNQYLEKFYLTNK